MTKHERVLKYTSKEKEITYKDDYISVIMYTMFLYFFGISINIFYVVFFEYLDITIIDYIFLGIQLFILLDSIFFTAYTINELAELIRKIK